MEKLIKANLRFLYVPLGILLTIVILSLVSFKVFSDRSEAENAQITSLTAQGQILDQKLAALQAIGSTINLSQNMSLALPSENPTFVMANQIRRYAADTNISVEGIQFGQEVTDTKGVSRVDINIDAVGNPVSILAFVLKLKNASPITLGSSIAITQKGGEIRSTISTAVYWASLPEKLPAITEPISDLTADEKDIISKVSKLDTPILGTSTQTATSSSVTSGAKSNPFGF